MLTSQPPGENSELSNEYIEIVLDENGRFTLGTTGGEPDNDLDNNKKLLYGHPYPGTSWTVVKIDTLTYTFGSGGTWDITPQIKGDDLIASYNYGNINVKLEISITESYSTSRSDSGRILYTITNNDTVAHNLGTMIMLDTMLGNNDGAPFYVLGTGEVTHDTKWTSTIPQCAQVFDSLSNPTVTGLFEFWGFGYDAPDEVILGYWPDVGYTFYYPFDPNKSFLDHDGDGVVSGSCPDSDSAVLVYYSTVSFSAGESKTYGVKLGLGEIERLEWGPFLIGLSAPTVLELNPISGETDYNYIPNPLNIITYVQNRSARTVTNAKLEINMYENFKLASGESAVKYIEEVSGSRSIAAGEMVMIDWNIYSYGGVIGESFYSITASGENADEKPKSIVNAVNINGAAKALWGRVTDNQGNPIAGSTLRVMLNRILVGTRITSSNGTYYMGGLNPGEYEIIVTADNYSEYSFYHTVTERARDSSSANPVLSLVSSNSNDNFRVYVYPNPVKQLKNINIYFTTESAGDVKIRIFNSAGRLIDGFTRSISSSGEHFVPWNTERCANGIYFCQVKFGSKVKVEKFAVIKIKEE